MRSFPLRSSLLAIVLALGGIACTPPADAAARITLDLGTYRGWWQILAEDRTERDSGECFGLPRCRPARALDDGIYDLLFSDEPQSEVIRFSLRDGVLSLVKGGSVVATEGNTLRLTALKSVMISLGGYQGPWSIDKWSEAAESGYFRTDGTTQVIELVPLTTYGLRFGATTSERIQVGLDGRLVVIDARGAVVAGDAGRLDVKTIDVVIYPMPDWRRARWNVGFERTPTGRPFFDGAAIVRLVQGSTYAITEAGEMPADAAARPLFATGKACSMTTETVRGRTSVFHIVPIPASCAP